ncbi:hypothetical protein EYF80_023955 [Liparis tanakae]|uniref:Uncharacterized protein n=1 Tax=Liparis tanakae TaxID=230148 RepID=A0A4Z2HLC8_9TELE|nr:hypothetical protein EYF80_023955 [Liparis tanakae]
MGGAEVPPAHQHQLTLAAVKGACEQRGAERRRHVGSIRHALETRGRSTRRKEKHLHAFAFRLPADSVAVWQRMRREKGKGIQSPGRGGEEERGGGREERRRGEEERRRGGEEESSQRKPLWL